MKGRFGAFDLIRQLVKTLRGRRGLLFQLLLIRQAVVLQKARAAAICLRLNTLAHRS